jgi:hypothetical protein
MEAGDTSVIGSAMSQLAAISPNSKGASVLEQDSASYGASSSSSSSSISQLLQSLDTNSSGSSQSTLSLLA